MFYLPGAIEKYVVSFASTADNAALVVIGELDFTMELA